MSHFDTMQQALREAADAQRTADAFANRIASLLQGRLRHVDRHTLVAMKRELAGFNSRTRQWKR